MPRKSRSLQALRESQENKADRLAQAVDYALDVGKPGALPVVDFADANRPRTCLEVDFPIIPINQIAAIEGNVGKPIYQMSKWWARRRSSVFRALLLSAATRSPDDAAEAARVIWDNFYRNHQENDALRKLRVADIFMGGGTTLVEGARLGMQMFGNDLNPVAWFVVKNELAQVEREEVEALLADIEAEVKPQIMPFYACNGPNGERGIWTEIDTGTVMGDDFDPLTIPPEDRKRFKYEGPEIIYVFWAKHGPCQRTGCGHRTPILSSPVLAVKEISVKTWPDHNCQCGANFDIEEFDVRMAPDAPLLKAKSEKLFVPLAGPNQLTACPDCGHKQRININKDTKSTRKKVELSLLIHPDWLAGEAPVAPDGKPHGGSVTDSAEDTARWNQARARRMRFIEYRGPLPDVIEYGEADGKVWKIDTRNGSVPKKSNYACGRCGTVQDILTTVKASGKSGPVAAYMLQGYCPGSRERSSAYGGRFFAAVQNSAAFDAAAREWEQRRDRDLAPYWPRSELPHGFMTHHLNGGIPNHGFTHWWTMFNPRQLLVHALLLKAIHQVGDGKHRWEAREYVLGAFQQYLRNQCMLSFWHRAKDHFAPALSNGNYHPKDVSIECGVFCRIGYGPWTSSYSGLPESVDWSADPWELVSTEFLQSRLAPKEAADLPKSKSVKVRPEDPVLPRSTIACGSATDLGELADGTFDLVVTDPPFGGLVHYSELSDFFYVWLRLVLKDRYPDYFTAPYVPKTLEAVSNKARQPEDPDGYYRKLLTQAWKQAYRILKPGGILAFTFHHAEDAPWVDVLESLFEGGFYLEAVYPIRSDETKGEGEFGAKQVEYDIIHVCRKRTDDPKPVSWALMRRQVLEDIKGLKQMLELHQKAGLPEADLQLIRCGKALEYYSRHYGKVMKANGDPMDVKDAMAGIRVLLDEESLALKDPPPAACDGMTRQFLRMFTGTDHVARDQVQKYLRGTSLSPSQYEERGWCFEKAKVFHMTPFLEIARRWHGKPRQHLASDYDQAAFVIGACYEGSNISVKETLSNPKFKAHPALGELVQWFADHGPNADLRKAARQALVHLRTWQSKQVEIKDAQQKLNLES